MTTVMKVAAPEVIAIKIQVSVASKKNVNIQKHALLIGVLLYVYIRHRKPLLISLSEIVKAGFVKNKANGCQFLFPFASGVVID
ncbi:hypothetical protein Dtox_0551 [Desulfofarcimen acetoxidans DSM 771]|uniref:Uncharacterized protein n=2 Tax=Desulfofarcimen acetoxidans TaxID=58138 RepID=C8W616_DESAS|nr:hypothetical protein Dtox_0551 [Desulfofarcimen acetoxidans DSM 771]